MHLTEISIDKEHEWLGHHLSQITIEAERLIIIVKRNNRVIIPNGKTLIKENDILVMSQI